MGLELDALGDEEVDLLAGVMDELGKGGLCCFDLGRKVCDGMAR